MTGGGGDVRQWLFRIGKGLSEIAVVVAFAAIAIVFLREPLFADRVLVGGSLFTETYPRYEFLRASLLDGRLPLWNPYSGLGRPFLADPTNAVLYPPSLLVRWLSPEYFVAISSALHMALAAWATYLCARNILKVGVLAGAAAGSLYGFGGLLIGQIDNVNFTSAAAWIPGVILAVYLMMHRRSVAWGGVAAAMLSVQFLAGSLHLSFVTAILASVVAFGVALRQSFGPLWRLTLIMGSDGVSSRMLPSIGSLLAVFGPAIVLVTWTSVLAVNLVQVQVRPFLELLGESTPPSALAVGPEILSRVQKEDLIRVLLPTYLEQSGTPIAYIGFLAIGLVCIGIVRGYRSYWTWFLVAVAAVGLVFSLGVPGPIQSVYELFPGYRWFERRSEWLVLYVLAVSLLAAVGVQSFVTQLSPIRRRGPAPEILGALVLPALLLFALLQVSGGLSSLPIPTVWQIWIGLSILLFDLLFILSLLRPSWWIGGFLVTLVAVEVVASGTLTGNELRSFTTISGPLYREAKSMMPSFGQLESGARIVVQPAIVSTKPTIDDLRNLDRFQSSERDRDTYLRLVTMARNLEGALASVERSGVIVARDPGGRFPITTYARWVNSFSPSSEFSDTSASSSSVSVTSSQLGSRSLPDGQLLSLGAVRYVIGESDDDIFIGGELFDLALEVVLEPGQELALPTGLTTPVTSIQLITSIDGNAEVSTGSPAIELRSITSDGSEIQSQLNAGIETGLAPYDILAGVAHSRPASVVRDQTTGSIYGYHARVSIGLPVRIQEVRIRNILQSGDIHIRAVTTVDDRIGESRALNLDPAYRSVTYNNPKSYELLATRSRVALVHRSKEQSSTSPILEARDIGTNTVLLPRNVNSSIAPGEVSPSPLGSVVARFPSPTHISIFVDTTDPGWIVVSDIDYPGWKATFDGIPATIVRANGLTRAVRVPEGRHQIELFYEPQSFASGLDATQQCLTVIGLAIALVVTVDVTRGIRRRYFNETPATSSEP